MRNQIVTTALRSLLLVLLILSVTESYTSQKRRKLQLDHTDAILINQYMMRTGDEALLITDPVRIKQMVDLFQGNETVPHACAYHWNIWFRQSATDSIPFSHNEDCEVYKFHDKEIHSILNGYFKSILSAPRYFMVNVKISASVEPEEGVRLLEDDSNKVFFFNGIEERLPSLNLQAVAIADIPKSRRQWDAAESKNLKEAETKLRKAIENLRERYPVVKATNPEHRSGSFGGGKIEDAFEATVYFRYGTHLNDLQQTDTARILRREEPSSYVLQLVSQTRFSDAFRKTLLSRSPLILDVTSFRND